MGSLASQNEDGSPLSNLDGRTIPAPSPTVITTDRASARGGEQDMEIIEAMLQTRTGQHVLGTMFAHEMAGVQLHGQARKYIKDNNRQSETFAPPRIIGCNHENGKHTCEAVLTSPGGSNRKFCVEVVSPGSALRKMASECQCPECRSRDAEAKSASGKASPTPKQT